jgi:SAM-dependent methyltransferase
MVDTWSKGDADYNMGEEILVSLAQIISRHPWWLARAHIVLEILKSNNVPSGATILEAGCGWGTNLFALEAAGYDVTGLDISRQALDMLDKPTRKLVECDLTKPLPPGTQQFDAVLALDVLEHLDDDAATVKILGELCKPGGMVIISVPALPELFSEFDDIQGHRRRYLPETLRKAFVGSGLEPAEVLWWGSWMVPLMSRRKKPVKAASDRSAAETYKSYLKTPPWPGSALLKLAFALDEPRTLRGKSKTGTSLIAIARKPR